MSSGTATNIRARRVAVRFTSSLELLQLPHDVVSIGQMAEQSIGVGHGRSTVGLPCRHGLKLPRQSQPRSRASRAAAVRLGAPSLRIASDR